MTREGEVKVVANPADSWRLRPDTRRKRFRGANTSTGPAENSLVAEKGAPERVVTRF